MADVFISYKAEDRARVRPLVEALQADGLSVWWDAHIGGGDDWRESIAANLEQARCVIVIWSKRSIGPDGRFVRDEAGRAVRRNTYLPVTIDKVEPPLGFGETQCLPMTGWKASRDDPRYLTLLDAVRQKAGSERDVTVRPTRENGVSRRAVAVGAGAAALALVGGAGWVYFRPRDAGATSIAILPFANLSGDPREAYFSDGMAEELRSALARLPNLKVVARTSSELVRNMDAASAAHRLGVATILTGSVRRSPDTIRVTAQLIDGSNGLERWSQSFDRAAGDILQIQSGIAQNVAEALRVEFSGDAQAVLSVGGTNNPVAQDLLLKAAPASTGDDEAGYLKSVQLLDRAIALDPNYAEAFAYRALALSQLGGQFPKNAADGVAKLKLAAASARHAVQLAPAMPLGHASLAAIIRSQFDFNGALTEFERAIALPGADAATFGIYADMLAELGRFGRADRLLQRAIDLDPLNPLPKESMCMTLVRERKYHEAEQLARSLLTANPDRLRVYNLLASAQIFQRRPDDALASLAKVPAGEPHRLTREAIIAARAGDVAGSDRILGQLRGLAGDSALYQYAQIYAQQGNKDRAFDTLNAAFAARDPGLPSILTDEFMDPLRSDPRFSAFLDRLQIPRK